MLNGFYSSPLIGKELMEKFDILNGCKRKVFPRQLIKMGVDCGLSGGWGVV
jgi:hypothetical protein